MPGSALVRPEGRPAPAGAFSGGNIREYRAHRFGGNQEVQRRLRCHFRQEANGQGCAEGREEIRRQKKESQEEIATPRAAWRPPSRGPRGGRELPMRLPRIRSRVTCG